MGWKNFNDRLALLIMVLIPVLWVLDGRSVFTLKPEVIGATIVTWALVAQYYFRTKPPNGDSPK